MFLKKILLNRYVITIITLLLIALFWNIYVWGNNDGLIVGVVENLDGQPIKGATVSLYAVGTAGLLAEPNNVLTDEEGQFSYNGHELIEFTIDVSKSGYIKSEKKRYHTLFKSQNYQIREPIVLISET